MIIFGSLNSKANHFTGFNLIDISLSNNFKNINLSQTIIALPITPIRMNNNRLFLIYLAGLALALVIYQPATG